MADTRLMMLPELSAIIAISFAFHFKAYFKSTNALYQMNSISLQITENNGYEYKPLINCLKSDPNSIKGKFEKIVTG